MGDLMLGKISILFTTILVIGVAKANAYENNCIIYPPGAVTASDTYCPSGYGVTYKGQFVLDRFCYNSLNSAVSALRDYEICDQDPNKTPRIYDMSAD